MGNAVTCSLVDVVGTVSVTQANGQVLEFAQPVFASQVKKLHPGNWLVHYVSVLNGHDQGPAVGDRHGKMAILHGAEELHPGQMYFLLPMPSYVRKQVFGSKPSGSLLPKPNGVAQGAATSVPPPSLPGPPATPASRKKSQQPSKSNGNVPTVRNSREQDPSPVFSMPESSNAVFSMAESSVGQPRGLHPLQPTRKPKCSRKQKSNFYVLDWRPTLVTIEEVF